MEEQLIKYAIKNLSSQPIEFYVSATESYTMNTNDIVLVPVLEQKSLAEPEIKHRRTKSVETKKIFSTKSAVVSQLKSVSGCTLTTPQDPLEPVFVENTGTEQVQLGTFTVPPPPMDTFYEKECAVCSVMKQVAEMPTDGACVPVPEECVINKGGVVVEPRDQAVARRRDLEGEGCWVSDAPSTGLPPAEILRVAGSGTSGPPASPYL